MPSKPVIFFVGSLRRYLSAFGIPQTYLACTHLNPITNLLTVQAKPELGLHGHNLVFGIIDSARRDVRDVLPQLLTMVHHLRTFSPHLGER